MDWSTLLLGMVLGIILLPTLLMLGLRLLLWLLARKVKKLVKELEQNGGQMHNFGGGVQGGGGSPPFNSGWQVQTFGFGLPTADPGPAQVDYPALAPEMTLQEQFLRKTNLSPAEWEEARDRLVFVHDEMSDEELEELGFEPEGEGTARDRVRGQSQLLGSLETADVYVRLK